jgi:hypothetical protein
LDEAFERIEALETQIVGNAPVPGLPDLPKGWDR